MEREKTDLEYMFEKTLENISSIIQEKLDLADKLIQEAEQLAEEHGIPFYSRTSPLSQSYVPASFDKIWGDRLREALGDDYDDFASNYCLISSYGDQICGWEYSAVC